MKKIKIYIEFHYLLMEIYLYTLILFGIKHIQQKVSNKMKDKSITHNIFRIQDNG